MIDCPILPAATPTDDYAFPPVEAEPNQKMGIFSKEWGDQFSRGQPGCSGPLTDVYDWRDAGYGSNVNCESRMETRVVDMSSSTCGVTAEPPTLP